MTDDRYRKAFGLDNEMTDENKTFMKVLNKDIYQIILELKETSNKNKELLIATISELKQSNHDGHIKIMEKQDYTNGTVRVHSNTFKWIKIFILGIWSVLGIIVTILIKRGI